MALHFRLDKPFVGRNSAYLRAGGSTRQLTRRFIEQFLDRHPARDESLPPAEVDDDFERRPAGVEAEPVGIERAAVRQSRGALALMQLTKQILHHVGPRP